MSHFPWTVYVVYCLTLFYHRGGGGEMGGGLPTYSIGGTCSYPHNSCPLAWMTNHKRRTSAVIVLQADGKLARLVCVGAARQRHRHQPAIGDNRLATTTPFPNFTILNNRPGNRAAPPPV